MKSIKLWLNRDKPKVSQFKFGNLFKCIKGYFLIIFSSFLQALKLTAANFSFQYSLSKAAACMAAALYLSFTFLSHYLYRTPM